MRGDRRLIDLLRRNALGDDAAHGIDDLGAAAVVEGETERHARVVGGELFGVAHLLLQPARERFEPADMAHTDAMLVQRADLALDPARGHAHQPGDLLARPTPVLGRKGVECQHFDTALGEVPHHAADVLGAGLVALTAAETTQLRPAAVAIHDDGHVPRQAVRRHDAGRGCWLGFCYRGHRAPVLRWPAGRGPAGQTSSNSCSLSRPSFSTAAICASVSFWSCSCARRASSSEISLLRSSFLIASAASRRILRIATRPSSTRRCTSLTSSLRRCSESGGSTRRIMWPSLLGVRPRSDLRIAFSIGPSIERSHGWIVSKRGSGTLTVASWLIGIGVPW